MRTITIIASLLLIAGCSSTQPALDGKPEVKTHRVTGEVSTIVNRGLERTFDASVDAVKDDLKFTVESSVKDALVGVVKARTAENKLVTVTLNKKSDTVTSVSVTAGAFDSGIAKATVDRIVDRCN
ncbi:MAG: DUF3568 family protein [Phycisphaerales bacterium]